MLRSGAWVEFISGNLIFEDASEKGNARRMIMGSREFSISGKLCEGGLIGQGPVNLTQLDPAMYRMRFIITVSNAMVEGNRGSCSYYGEYKWTKQHDGANSSIRIVFDIIKYELLI